MKKSFLRIILCLGLFAVYFSCEKENADYNSAQQESYNAPTIENAKQFFEQNSGITDFGKTSSTPLQTDWQSSKTKDYKETPETDVDILYTPVYLQTERDAKAFIASTEQQNGNIESKIVFVLYKSSNAQTGLYAYVYVYNIDGTLELEYNLENGQPVSFPTGDGILSKTDCSELPGLSIGELIQWLNNCTVALDEVVVTAQLGSGGTEGGSGFDADLPNFMQIPYIGSMDTGDMAGPGSGGVNGEVYASNTISPTSFSIISALEVPFGSNEAQWLIDQSILNNQSVLDIIAQFLNSNKERPDEPAFGDVSNNQLPDVTPEAIALIIGAIEDLIAGPGLGNAHLEEAIEAFYEVEGPCAFEYSPEVCACVANGGNLEECLFEEKIDTSELEGKEKCAYNALKAANGNLMNETIGTFGVPGSSYNLTFVYADCPGSAEACTNVSDINNGNITIKIADRGLEVLEYAALLLHEGVHAEIFRYVHENGGNIDPNERINLYNWYHFYNIQEGNYEDVDIAQHQHMADRYVYPIARAIRELDGFRFPVEHYLGFGWDGLRKYGFDGYYNDDLEFIQFENIDYYAQQEEILQTTTIGNGCDE